MVEEIRDLRLRTGITVPCLVQGVRGRPLVLLHAWAESRGSFDRLVPLLTDFRVYAPDLRGQGDADKPTTGYSLAEQADDAAAILDALGIPRAVVLGSSSGGYVAQQLAVSHPDRVSALVLVSAPSSLHGRAPFADAVDRLTDPISEDWVRESLSWYSLQPSIPGWFIEDRIRDGVRMPAHAWRGILDGLTTATPPTEAGTIRAPSLILRGARDTLVPLRDQEALAARITSDVRLSVFEDAGHLLLWEQPDRIASEVAEFLRVPARATRRPGGRRSGAGE